ncbi:MAG: RNA polymerase sigma factor [Gammaproteobacteria bacterium]|nr:MAG: RNA polymerase sigma factor [Gammaproteobacteria bacterium]
MNAASPSCELIEAARTGDVGALNCVLSQSRQDLRRYAEYHCMVNDVEDAVQETLFTVSRRLRDLRSLESFTSWMFRIVKRECNRMRRGWRMLTGQEIDENILPPVLPETNEWQLQISRTLSLLPPHYREILLLRDVEGLSLQDIAEQTGMSLTATKSRLHRARMVAREMLDPRG